MRTFLLDYGAGNTLSVKNAVAHLGFELEVIETVDDFAKADRIIFPGVGAFGSCMERMNELQYVEPLKAFVAAGKPLLGICLGMQTLFEASDESPGVKGLGLIPGRVRAFDLAKEGLSVPHMGWNGINTRQQSCIVAPQTPDKFYFVHTFLALASETPDDWILTTTNYGSTEFVSSVQHGNVLATQFHPEKSGRQGLEVIERFLKATSLITATPLAGDIPPNPPPTQLAPRVIACLDVRSNDQGDLVVTKGDQYDVREKDGEKDVRNLGKPVSLAERYFKDGADEVSFLNITSFRSCPLKDQPMLDVLRETSKNVFVPLTIGGGIRDLTEPDGTVRSAVHVADAYFRGGADKVSIGSDAVTIAEEYLKTGKKTGLSSIETISTKYGAQAVVISVDPKRAYVQSPTDVKHHTFKTDIPGPNGEQYCWMQCTVRGGRETRDLGAYELVKACQELGAGEILLNCIDKDGTNSGYDLEFIRDIKSVATIPVIASSGAGCANDFYRAFMEANADAALAAGIFHRNEVPLNEVKAYLVEKGINVRPL